MRKSSTSAIQAPQSLIFHPSLTILHPYLPKSIIPCTNFSDLFQLLATILAFLLHLLNILNPSNFPRINLSSLSFPKGPIPRIRRHTPVPPAETSGEVVHEGLVVEIVVVSAGPEGDEFVERPGEVVATVGVDCLEQPKQR